MNIANNEHMSGEGILIIVWTYSNFSALSVNFSDLIWQTNWFRFYICEVPNSLC